MSEDTYTKTSTLDREISLLELIAIGIGSIIGSGIFILFASILQKSQKSTFLALAIAALPNIATALAYAELAGMYTRNDMEFNSIKDAFNDNVATISIYILLIFMVFNAATVILFTGHLLNMDDAKFHVGLLILLVLSFVNFLGITLSKSITNIVGVIEVTLLVTISLIASHLWKPVLFSSLPSTYQSQQFWLASFLGLFLYSGYDAVVKLTEETVNPQNNVPLGMIGTILITTCIYLLLSITATSLPNFKTIASSTTPITEMYKYIFNTRFGLPVTIIGIIIVINTFFISVISLSRFSYSLSAERKLPSFIGEINERFRTPHNAIISVFVVLAAALLVDSGETCAKFANVFFLIFMILIMTSVIILRMKNPDKKRSFIIPVNIMNVPVPLVLGICLCLFYLYIAFTHSFSKL